MSTSSSEPRPQRSDPTPGDAPAPEGFQNPEDASTGLFDLRKLIGALFTLYGIMLAIAGAFTTGQAHTKAGGININLWLGLAMLVLGLLFLLWAKTSPLRVEHPSALADAQAPPRPPTH